MITDCIKGSGEVDNAPGRGSSLGRCCCKCWWSRWGLLLATARPAGDISDVRKWRRQWLKNIVLFLVDGED